LCVIFIDIFVVDGVIDYGAQEEARSCKSPVHLEGSTARDR
jgi:hypothetical protein